MKATAAIGSTNLKGDWEFRSLLMSRLRLVLPLLLVFCAIPTHAQRYLAGLTGDVSDSTGAKVIGAVVTATDTTTNFVTKAVANSSGSYSIPFLTPDTYNITVEATGFRTETRTGVVFTAGSSVKVDFTLKVGSSTQTVTVSAADTFLNTESANLGTPFTMQQVTDLPSLGRVPMMVAALAAGAYDNGYIGAKTSNTIVPWGGGPTATTGNGVTGGHTRVTINGTPDDPQERSGTGGGSGNYTGFTPSPESVQEVKSETALYDAEYGHGGGTVINTVLRSGTNQLHGAAYFVFRNTYLNANTYERNGNHTLRPNGQWNEPGFVIDGPVRIPHVYDGRDKTFFMVAYERIQLRGAATNGATDLVPLPAMATGDFSSLCPGGFGTNGVCVSGGGVQIYDPLTLDANNNRTPFLNNQIPAGRISATGAALLKFFPAPNSTQSSTINYVSPYPIVTEKYYSVTSRFDQSINANNKLNAVFYKQVLGQQQPTQGFPTSIGPSGTDNLVFRNNEGGSLDYVSILPRGYVLDARVGVIYHPFGVIYAGNPYNLSSLGISSAGMAYQTFPGISFSDNYIGLQAASGTQISADAYMTTGAIVSKVAGRHNLRFGYEGELHRYTAQNPISGFGGLNYNRLFTQKNSVNVIVGSDAASGNPIASLLLGYPSSGSYANQVAFAVSEPYFAFFLQDDWRVASKVTLNLGVRWEDEVPFTERYNRMNTGFCTACVNPLQSSLPSGSTYNLRGGLTFATPSNREYYQNHLTHWQPRFGFSYALKPRLVLHGGFGIMFFNSYPGPFASGFSASTSYIATNDNTHPATSLANPFPGGVNLPSGSSLGLATQLGAGVNFIAPNYVNPRNMQWTVSAQAQLPLNMILQLAYAGNHTLDWENQTNINSLPYQYYNQGSTGVTFLQSKVTNPMAGLIPTNGNLNGATIQNQYYLLPYPEFGSVTEVNIPSGTATYNALQATVNKRMGHNLSVLGSFTWSHMMEALQYLNPLDPAPERYQDGNPTLLSNLAVIYELPSFSSMPRYGREIFGGWQLNGVMRAYNGTLVGNPGGVTWLSNPHLSHETYNRSFNTCYLNAAGAMVMTTSSAPACDSTSSVPAFQQHLPFTLNNTGPAMSGVRVREHPSIDLSLFKTFKIHESQTFELRGEFFNVLNTPDFGGPNTSPGNNAYGQVTLNQSNDPRLGQLTARFNF